MDNELKRGFGRAAELIAQHSSWRERLQILRRAPHSAVPRLVLASLASLPRAVEPVVCEIATPDRYEDGLTELASYLGRPRPALTAESKGLKHLLAYQRNCSGAIGMGDYCFFMLSSTFSRQTG